MSKEVVSFGTRQPAPSEVNRESAINPANSAEEKLANAREVRTRIPMSVPRQRLSCPDIVGHHVHWINDEPGRIMQAQQAGYEFVGKEEAHINIGDVAGDIFGEGTDMGDRVSVVVGTQRDDKTPLRAYLMKIRNEWYREDQSQAQSRVDDIHQAMRQGKQRPDGISDADLTNRYVKSVNMSSTYSRRG